MQIDAPTTLAPAPSDAPHRAHRHTQQKGPRPGWARAKFKMGTMTRRYLTPSPREMQRCAPVRPVAVGTNRWDRCFPTPTVPDRNRGEYRELGRVLVALKTSSARPSLPRLSVLGSGMKTRALYRAADGSWREARGRENVRLLYILKPGERWTLLDDDCVMVVHPDRPPKVVHPDGRVEEIAPAPISLS